MPELTQWMEYPVFGLIDLVEEFINEADYRLTFNKINTCDTLWSCLLDEDSTVFYTETDGQVSGFAIVSVDKDFSEEIFGYVMKFYISPRYRKKGLDRELIKQCQQWFEDKGASFTFATATASIGADQLFINLFKKNGYIELGSTLCKEIQH